MLRVIVQFGKSKVILTLIVGIGLISGYLSYSKADDPTLGILTDDSLIKAGDLESFRNFKIDFSILDDKRYKSLEIYGENPVDPGFTGEKTNPFNPI